MIPTTIKFKMVLLKNGLLKQTTYTLKFYNPSHLTYTLLKLINLVMYIPLTNA